MTLVYHVYPKDQWCDPKEETQPFVSKADFDDEVNLWKSNHKFASKLADDLTQDAIKERARIAALEARCRELEAALRNLNDTVKSMRNPQTLADVGLLLLKFNGPVFVADQLLGSGTETSVIKPAEITDENRCPRCGKAMMLPEYGCQACGWLLTASETAGKP